MLRVKIVAVPKLAVGRSWGVERGGMCILRGTEESGVSRCGPSGDRGRGGGVPGQEPQDRLWDRGQGTALLHRCWSKLLLPVTALGSDPH